MPERRRLAVLLLAAVLVSLAACAGGNRTPALPTRLVLMTHDSFLVSDGIIEAFEQAHGVDVEVLTAGDAGEMVNKAILTRDAPLADVMYGVDNTFLSRAVDAGIFDTYSSAALATVPDALKSGLAGLVTPIDYGDVCLNYDKEAFAGNTAPPSDLAAVADPAYEHQLVVENPATSSPGLAFLLATVGRFGESGPYAWQDYWRALRQNDVLVVDDWDSAYYSNFSGGSATGDRPLVVSYATSPAAEVVFADPPVSEAPTGVITDGCFRQIEYAAVLHGTKAPELARQFIDFMLSPEFQQDIPLNMFVFPANSAATPPAVFIEHAAQVTAPVELDAAQIAANRDRWVQEWTDVVLH